MKILSILTICCLMLMSQTNMAQDWAGTWEGTLKIGAQELKIVFHLKQDEAGKFSATMDSPDQMAYDLKVDETEITEDKINMRLNAANAAYKGTWNAETQQIEGQWIQGMSLALNLKKGKRKSIERPQTPQGPFPYSIEEVTYPNKKAGIKLAGTLTIPAGTGKHPVAILISGSGPQDRDETILKHKPFWVLADYLSRNGYAVLRYDDRGFGASEGDFTTATSADFATDVEAAIAFLRKHDKIDAKKIGLIGHSEGGLIAPIVASKDKKLAFIVLLAGPGIMGKDLLLEQRAAILLAEGVEADLATQSSQVLEKVYQLNIEDKEAELLTNDYHAAVQKELDAIPDEDKKKVGLDFRGFQQIIQSIRSPWMRYFLAYDPVPYLKKVRCPILALNGSKDLQVLPKSNLEGIETALKASKNTQFKIQELPDLNHLFQTAETGAPSEYVEIEETFSPDAMQVLLDWLKDL